MEAQVIQSIKEQAQVAFQNQSSTTKEVLILVDGKQYLVDVLEDVEKTATMTIPDCPNQLCQKLQQYIKRICKDSAFPVGRYAYIN